MSRRRPRPDPVRPGWRRVIRVAVVAGALAAGAALNACGPPGAGVPGAAGAVPGGGGNPGEREVAGAAVAGTAAAGVLYWAALDLEPGPAAAWEVDAAGRPLWPSPGASATWLRRLVHAGLLQAGPGGQLLPDLADTHTSAAGGRIHRFHLRAGARSSDGTPVTGGDVVDTWRAHLDRLGEAARVVDSVAFDAARGDVVLSLSRPADWLVRFLALLPVQPAGGAAGAGPFRLSGQAGDRWVLEAVENESGAAGGAAPARIEVAPVDPRVLEELIARGVHLISGLTGSQVEALRPAWEAAGYRSTSVPRGWRLAMLINPVRGPLDDARVRRALGAVLDRAAAAAALEDARPVPAGVDGAPPLDAALAEAGYSLADGRWVDRRGTPLSLSLVVADGLWADLAPGTPGRLAEALAGGLRGRGLNVETRVLDGDAFLRQVYEFRAFDLALLPLPLDETGRTAGIDAWLAVDGLPPLPVSPSDEATVALLADPVTWALHRLDGVNYRVDETAGLVRVVPFRQETKQRRRKAV
ncbi:MAG TPA: ABC transporter substrate-binding protein [Bacillota bacterium]